MPVRIFNDDMVEYLKEIAPGKYMDEITRLFNRKFQTSFTEGQIRNFKIRNGIRSNVKTKAIKPRKLFAQEQEDYIYKNLHGKSNEEIANMVNEKFGTSYKATQVDALKGRRKWNSGLTGYFPKGNKSWNTGTKGLTGANKTSFKKGNKPHNWVPIGSERITKDGYIQIKVQEGKQQHNWKGKHILIWEEHNGPVPLKHAIIFADGNIRNFDIDNLICIHRRELLVLNQDNLIQSDAELTKTAINIAKLQIKVQEVKKNG